MNFVLTFFSYLVYLTDMINWGCSSDGRALDWQSRGRRFDPVQLHKKRSSICIFFIVNAFFLYGILSTLCPLFLKYDWFINKWFFTLTKPFGREKTAQKLPSYTGYFFLVSCRRQDEVNKQFMGVSQ